MRHHGARVEPGAHGDGAEHGLDQGQQQRQHAQQPRSERRPQRSTAIAVSSATSATIVVSKRLPNSIARWMETCWSANGVTRPGRALRRRGAAQPGAGQPHDAAGDDDARPARRRWRRAAGGSARGSLQSRCIGPRVRSTRSAPPERAGDQRRGRGQPDQQDDERHDGRAGRAAKAARSPSPSAPDGRYGAIRSSGVGMTEAGTTTALPASSSTQTRLATASTASARSRPASSRASATKVAAPTSRKTSAGSTPSSVRPPAQRQAEHASTTTWTAMTDEGGHGLGGQQPGPAERGAAEHPQHAVPPVEAGLDGLTGEGRGDQRQGQDPGRDDVDPPGRAEVGGVRLHQADQDQGRQDDGDEQLLAVADQHGDLAAGLGQDPLPRAARRPAPATGRAGAVTRSPVRSGRGRRPRGCARRW